MRRDFMEFLRTLCREWVPLLTGGSVIALLALWQMSGRQVPQSVHWLVVGLTLMVAAFLSWRKEWIQLGRGLVTESPEALVQIIKDKTGIQARIYLAKYIGRRITIRGYVSDVSNVLPWWHLVYIDAGNRDAGNRLLISCGIALGAFKIFSVLPRGAEITVSGRIREVHSLGLQLASCSLLEIHQSPKLTDQKMIKPES